MSWSREENILPHNLFEDQIIQNCPKIEATNLFDNDLLLKQKTQKEITYPGSWYNSN